MSKESKKRKDNVINKTKLWNVFDEEINDKTPLECIYRACGNRENCERCNNNLAFSDEGDDDEIWSFADAEITVKLDGNTLLSAFNAIGLALARSVSPPRV